jgi:hypothetical protein
MSINFTRLRFCLVGISWISLLFGTISMFSNSGSITDWELHNVPGRDGG